MSDDADSVMSDFQNQQSYDKPDTQMLDEHQLNADLRKTAWVLAGMFFLGWAAVCCRSLIFAHNEDRLSAAASLAHQSYVSARATWMGEMWVGFLWTLAWLAVGFLFGFLFGVPKVVVQSTTTDTGAKQQDLVRGPRLKVNTNLEEISDWLTKILVGATLTQLSKIPHLIGAVATWMADTDASNQAHSFMGAIVTYYAALGFLSGYLMTRMFLTRAFSITS